MVRLRGLGGITVGLLTVLATTSCLAQAPTLGNELPQAGNYPGTSASLLGPIPGSGGATYSDPAVGGGQILGGRPGASTPRVPTSISDPGNQAGTPLIPGAQALPAAQPLTAVPLYGSLDLPTVDDEGPADGLTYDDALARLLEFNPELAARRIEIPMARADVVTASLRANPIFYSDAQLVPYGEYTKKSPGGQTQYDVNISHPLDLSHKRKQRSRVATQALRAVEVQYLDAVRIQIGNMGNAYVDALAARETLRYVEAGQKGLDSVLEATQGLAARGSRTSADVGRILAQRQSARVGVIEATERYRRARATLGGYLALAPAESEPLELRAALQPPEPVVPPEEQLASLALSCRPDVVAARIGVAYATAGLDLQRANRFADAYLLFQPYTFQNK
jgi:cobalt-zinc-cadmium efflux system outer membrane protein